MIGTSFGEWIFIRLSISFFRYTPLLYAAALLVLVLSSQIYGGYSWHTVATGVLCALLVAEGLFAGLIYFPFTRRLDQRAVHPIPLSPTERRGLFERVLMRVQSPEAYLRWWFLGADLDEIRRDNVREFLLWAFFERGDEGFDDTDEDNPDLVAQELDDYIALLERRLGRQLGDGRGTAKGLRLTVDKIETTYRSLLWYVIVFVMDQATHIAMLWHGFQYYSTSARSALSVFPPRPQQLLSRRRSPARGLSYWHHPHRSSTALPVVFFHGIGIGLWTYTRFLADVQAARGTDADGNIGVIAVELLPVSFRLTAPPPDKAEILRQITDILDSHGWDQFAVASHSYGSVITTHMLRCPTLGRRIPSVVLIDPVTLMLHLPDVAYNFTRRRPKRANEWQLWYFASTDPGVALCLGRYFFWRENIIWKEELLNMGSGDQQDAVGAVRSQGRSDGVRRAAVSLSGRDLIVDAASVAQYLAEGPDANSSDSQEGKAQVLVFPELDHAQVFDDPVGCQRVVQVIRSHCTT